MELNETEVNSGIQWLLGAAVVAVIFSFALFNIDQYLEGSRDRDVRHNLKMRELRLAQASLSSGPIDERLIHPSRQGMNNPLIAAPAVHDTHN